MEEQKYTSKSQSNKPVEEQKYTSKNASKINKAINRDQEKQ